MPIYLKYNTASQEIPLGYFVDSTDGNTEETGLTIANTDIKLWKNGATTLANKNSGGATHISNGLYYAVLDATDTNTVGPMVVFVHVSGALPVRVECVVLPALVFDSLIAGSDNLQVDAVQVSGTSQTARDLGASVLLSPGTGTGQISLSSGAVTVGTNNDKTGYTASTVSDKTGYSLTATTGLGNQTANITGNLSGSVGSVTGAVGSVTGNVGGNVTGSVGSVTAGVTVTTNNDKTGYGLSAAAVQAIWDALTSALTTVGSIGKKLADWVIGTTQTGDSFARLGAPVGASISADIAAVKAQTAAIETDTQDLQTQIGAAGAGLSGVPWNAAWDAEVQSECTDALNAYDPPTKAELDSGLAGLNDPTAAAIADAVWDETLADHLGAGSTGNALNAAGAAGDPWSTALPGAYGAGTAGKIIGDNINAPIATVDTVVDAIKAKTDNLPADPADDSDIDAQLAAIAGYIDTEIAAIKAKTDNLPASPAATGDIPTAAAIADAVWDEAATGHTDAGKAGAQLWTDIDAILLDTGTTLDGKIDTITTETQSHPTLAEIEASAVLAKEATLTTMDGKLDTIDNFLDTEIAAILADTNELQTDLANGGRLDLLVDAIKAKTDLIPASPAAVGDIPTTAEIKAAVEAAGSHLALILEDTGTTLDGKLNTIDAVVDLVEDIVRNKMEIDDATGDAVLYEDDGATPKFSVAACVTDDSTTTTRKRLA